MNAPARPTFLVLLSSLLTAAALALAACGTSGQHAAGPSPCARHGAAFGKPCAPASASTSTSPSASASASVSPSASASTTSPAPSSAPVFAYYYMWMQGAYWTTNKLDHPATPVPGNYNSDDPAVINWQIQQAKAAGITGFLVSWKNNATYQKIVPLVEYAANQNHFKLALMYESLNAAKHPLPVSQVGADLQYFVANYASNPAWYTIRGKPVAVWDGTQDYSASAVASVTGPVRSRILVLSSGQNVTEYKRLAAYTDGDAYYWSSVNLTTNPGAPAKLKAIGAAVHANHGIWIAPFAPGYNSTRIGGHIIVPRNNGATLKNEYAVAAASSPDILGLISWNEWTENTNVEPSMTAGYTYLNVLKGLINPGG
jgi:hypothetical protein